MRSSVLRKASIPICASRVSWLLTACAAFLYFPLPFLVRPTVLKAAVDSAETAVKEAQEETTKAIGAEEDDGDGTAARPPPKSVLSSDQEYLLVSTAKKARKAGNSVPQVSMISMYNECASHPKTKRAKSFPSTWTSSPTDIHTTLPLHENLLGVGTSRNFLTCNASDSASLWLEDMLMFIRKILQTLFCRSAPHSGMETLRGPHTLLSFTLLSQPSPCQHGSRRVFNRLSNTYILRTVSAFVGYF